MLWFININIIIILIKPDLLHVFIYLIFFPEHLCWKMVPPLCQFL